MKHKIIIIICVLFFAISCKKNESNSLKTADKIEVYDSELASEKTSVQTIKDCDDFLDTYETWANDLLTLMANYKDDPIGLVSSPEYSKNLVKSSTFMQEWQKISMSCASSKHYSKRMEAIQERIEKKQKELGLKN